MDAILSPKRIDSSWVGPDGRVVHVPTPVSDGYYCVVLTGEALENLLYHEGYRPIEIDSDRDVSEDEVDEYGYV